MALGDWILLIILVVYVLFSVIYLWERYRFIGDCPVPLWSEPWSECFGCPHANRCGRISRLYQHWGCTPEELDELDKMIEERRAEFERDNLDKEIVEEDRNNVL